MKFISMITTISNRFFSTAIVTNPLNPSQISGDKSLACEWLMQHISHLSINLF